MYFVLFCIIIISSVYFGKKVLVRRTGAYSHKKALIITFHRCDFCIGYNDKSSAVAEMGDRLATIGVGRKWGGAAMGAGSPLGPHLTQCYLGRGLPLYQVASSSIQPFGHNCRNATLLRVGICLRTIFIPSLVVKTFTGCVHWVIAWYQFVKLK